MRTPAAHGTRSRYVTGCRCPECRFVALRYAKMHYWARRKLLKVSCIEARQHILGLNSYGLGDVAIAESCGCGPATVRLIRLGRKPFIYRRTEQRILAVTPEGIADGALVDARVTRNLLRSLLHEGWSRQQLCAALGRKGRVLSMLSQQQVTAATEMRVEKLYRAAMKMGSEGLFAMRGPKPGKRVA